MKTALAFGLCLALIGCAHSRTETMSPRREVAQEDCQWGKKPTPLTLTYPSTSLLKSPVIVSTQLSGNFLNIHFDVAMDPQQIHAKKKLAPGEYPFQFDVVEVFVSVAGKEGSRFPYYEFELSPYGETFLVLIEMNNGKKRFTNNPKLGIESKTQMTSTGWTGDLSINLNELHWDGNPERILGNAFAVLGVKESRSYWSASLPAQVKPNFHLPEYFQPLATCLPNP